MPLELLQAIGARLQAHNTDAIAGFNRSQFRLLRTVGQPPVTDKSENQAK